MKLKRRTFLLALSTLLVNHWVKAKSKPIHKNWQFNRVYTPNSAHQFLIDNDGRFIVLDIDGHLWSTSSKTGISWLSPFGDQAAEGSLQWHKVTSSISTRSSLNLTPYGLLAQLGNNGILFWANNNDKPSVFSVPNKLMPYSGMICDENAIYAIIESKPGSGKGQVIRISLEGQKITYADIAPLPDAQLSYANGLIAVLTEPSDRYDHGVLGDTIEAASASWLDSQTLALKYQYKLESANVFEERSLLPIKHQQETLWLTIKSGPEGAQTGVFRQTSGQMQWQAIGPPLGVANRWISPVNPYDNNDYFWRVKNPHLSGTLQKSKLNDQQWQTVALGVANHAIGHRQTNVCAWLDSETLVMGTVGLKKLAIININNGVITVQDTFSPISYITPTPSTLGLFKAATITTENGVCYLAQINKKGT